MQEKVIKLYLLSEQQISQAPEELHNAIRQEALWKIGDEVGISGTEVLKIIMEWKANNQ